MQVNRSLAALRRWRVLAFSCGPVAFGLAGCGSLGVDTSLSAAQIRFVQVSPGGPDMDFYVNGSGAAYGLGFATFTSYLPVNPGLTSLSVTKAGAGQALAQGQTGLLAGHQYTAVLSHGMGNLREVVYADQDTPAPQGQIAVRVLNEVEAMPAVSVYVVPAGSGGGVPPVAVFSLSAGGASGYLDLPANGSYTVTAMVAEGALNVPIGSVTVKAVSGAVQTLIFGGTVQSGGHGIVGFALEDVSTP